MMAARLAFDTVIVAILLFISAGTMAWTEAWVLLGVMLSIRGTGAYVLRRTSPDLLHERARLPVHAEQPRADRMLLLGVLATGFLGLPIVAGLDVFRLHAFPAPAPAVARMGLLLFASGWVIKQAALHANRFAVSVARLQTERGHGVADTGLYGIVRHPFYAADPLILVGLGLWLQSYLAALCALVPVSIMVARLVLEERMLRRELPGYVEYAARVQYRLIPGLW